MIPDSNHPSLPERIARLEDPARDLWWGWHAEARAVFRRRGHGRWRRTAPHPPPRHERADPPRPPLRPVGGSAPPTPPPPPPAPAALPRTRRRPRSPWST